MTNVQRIIYILTIALLFPGCRFSAGEQLHGYIEGDYVYVASPIAGRLETVAVARGDLVKTGDTLFTLENTPWKAERDEAAGRLAQARAQLEDMRKGARDSEIESLEARLAQAQALLQFSRKELVRITELRRTKAAPQSDLDRTTSDFEQARNRVAELESELETARLGSRAGQISAQENAVEALSAALARAEWRLSQSVQKSPSDALVVDTMYRVGEWANEGKPVAMLLPPANIKARTFVPEEMLGRIRIGQPVQVRVDGTDEMFRAAVAFISPNAEYTPPVIYSRESREKLVFLVELSFDAAVAPSLHPGQPIDLEFES